MTLTRFDKDTQVQHLAGGLNNNSDIVEAHFAALNPHPQGRLVVDVSGDQDVTLTAEEARSAQLVFEGTLTGDISVIVPNNNMVYHVQNLTSGAYTLTLKTGAGTGVPIQQASLPDYPRIKRVVCDGTNIAWADDSQIVEDNLHEAAPDNGYYEVRANGWMECFGATLLDASNHTGSRSTTFNGSVITIHTYDITLPKSYQSYPKIFAIQSNANLWPKYFVAVAATTAKTIIYTTADAAAGVVVDWSTKGR